MVGVCNACAFAMESVFSLTIITETLYTLMQYGKGCWEMCGDMVRKKLKTDSGGDSSVVLRFGSFSVFVKEHLNENTQLLQSVPDHPRQAKVLE